MDIQRLETYQKTIAEISHISERIESLRSAMTNACSHLSQTGVSGSISSDKIANQVAELQKLEDEHKERRQFLETESIAIEEWISSFPVNQAMVIRCRYVYGFKWDVVARMSGYANRMSCWRVIEKALNAC